MFAPGTRLHAHVCRTMRRFGCGVTHRTVGTLFHNHQTHNTRTVASRAARRAICVIGIVVFAQVPRPRGDRSETQQNQRPANTRVNVRLFILDRNTARAVHRLLLCRAALRTKQGHANLGCGASLTRPSQSASCGTSTNGSQAYALPSASKATAATPRHVSPLSHSWSAPLSPGKMK